MQNNVHWACIICIIIVVQWFKLRRLTVVMICSIDRAQGSMCYIAVVKGHESNHLGELVTNAKVNLWEIQCKCVNSWWKIMFKKKQTLWRLTIRWEKMWMQEIEWTGCIWFLHVSFQIPECERLFQTPVCLFTCTTLLHWKECWRKWSLPMC